jgi:DNA adenine methylase
MKPPFTYYGAKTRLAEWIVGLMPPHQVYVEAFAGSGAVLLAKPQSRHEVMNDLDSQLFNFWRVLRDQPEELVGSLQLSPYGREEFYFDRKSPSVDNAVEMARRFYVANCLAFNNSGDNCGYSANRMSKMTLAQTFHRKIDNRLIPVAQRLRCVELENLDAVRLIQRWSDPATLVYADPPYLGSTRAAVGFYARDNGSEQFHKTLLAALQDFPGKVILSGYRSPLYQEMLGHWTVMDSPFFSYAGGHRTETLWLNYEPVRGS